MIGCAIVAGVGLAYMLLGRPYERSEAPSGDAVMGARIVHPVVELTRRLVAIPSENPPGNQYAECVALLEAELERLDLKPRRLTDLILEASVGEGDRPLYFHGHYDVVPAQNRSQFEPYIEGDRLYGRGSADMKGGLAAMIHAMVALRDTPGRVVLHLVPDEETGGERGSRLLGGPRRHRDAHDGADQRRRVERQPGRALDAGDDPRERPRTSGSPTRA